MTIHMIHFKQWASTLGLGTLLSLSTWGQTQKSGTLLNTEDSYHGYTLLDPMGSTWTYLINNCGEVVNTWSSDHNSGGACYLLEDGSLARGCRMDGAFSGGGIGGRIERRAWTGELLWALDWADEETHHHHDFAWMPNGHVLVLAWEHKSASAAADAGRTNPQVMWPESIVEIEPTMPTGGNVVWEWHAWDHLVQNTDDACPTLANPHPIHDGLTSTMPMSAEAEALAEQRVATGCMPTPSTTIRNSIKCNQLRRFNEIWIVDHNTTTEEATGSAGDLLYRYGNPEAYGRGTVEDRVLFGQHDVQWIPEGHPQAGQLMVYSNGNDRPGCQCSTIDIWSPPLVADGTYEIPEDEAMGPGAFSWTYPQSPSTAFYSPNISGVQPLPNGNHLICEGAYGHLFEVTLEGELVWDYVNPEGNAGVFPQGTTPQQNAVFRAYRYGAEYPGLEDKELVAGAPLQGGGGAPCELYANVDSTVTQVGTFDDRANIAAFPSPTTSRINLTSPSPGTWHIFNNRGQIVFRCASSGHQVLNCESWPNGIYIGVFNAEGNRPLHDAIRWTIAH